MRAVDESGGPTLETLESAPLPEPPEGLALATEALIGTSALLGMDHAATRLELADESFSLPFDEAVAFLKARVPLTKPEWEALEPKLRFRAFTVAALSTPDAVERVRRSAIDALEKGQPLSEFWTQASAEAAAGLGESPWYWETVYRTNVQTAYNAGRAIELSRNQSEYLEFVGIGDVRQTGICRARSGTLLPASHPFWKSNWPPLHFNCRSTVRAVYQEEVDAMRSADPSWRPTSDEALPGDEPSAGFGGNPVDGGSFWKMTKTMYDRAEKLGILGDIEALAERLGIDRAEIVLTGDGARGSHGRPRTPKPAQPGGSGEAGAKPAGSAKAVPTFRSVKEAETWIVENDLADYCAFKGCDLRVVQAWTEKLNEHYASFPSARKDMQFFGTIQARNARIRELTEASIVEQLRARGITDPQSVAYAKQLVRRQLKIPKVTASTLAEYTSWDGAKGISLNSRYGSSYEDFLAVRMNDVQQGWKPQGTERITATLHHEAGHWLDGAYGLSADPEINSLYRSLSPADLEAGLSGYAASARRTGLNSIQEFIAEGWSEYMESGTPRPLAKKIGEIIERRARWK